MGSSSGHAACNASWKFPKKKYQAFFFHCLPAENLTDKQSERQQPNHVGGGNSLSVDPTDFHDFQQTF